MSRASTPSLVLVSFATVASGACAPIEEPWVSDARELATERDRAPATARELRHRVYRGQTDR